jgi:transposase
LINGEGQKIDAADAFGRKGRSELDSVELSSSTRRIVDNLLTNLDLLTVQIKDLDVEIEGVAEIDPVVKLLKTIDGVGSFTALAIRSAIGEIERFRSAKAFASYTGLIPGYRHSGDKQCNGPITKRGVSTLRWVLIQAVPHAVRHSEYLKKLYFRICYRSSVGKAKVAVAHALARIIYHVWREARPYYR